MDIPNKAGWGEKWPAPAKINLMLRIVGRRKDGYHLLQTVFQFIDLCDWLTFYPQVDGRVFLENPLPSVPEEEDLVIRAANLLRLHTGCSEGVKIKVEKNLPMGGGLGGGSSDAATVLIVLNRLWGLNLPASELMTLGLELGADVPVFVFGHAAWGEGVGERLSAIDLPEPWIVLIKPDCHVNTKEIFTSKELTRDSKSITIDEFLAGDAINDCLPVVLDSYGKVKEAFDELSSFGNSQLTGTGACVFATFFHKEDAEHAFNALLDKWDVYLSRRQVFSPLYKKLETFRFNSD